MSHLKRAREWPQTQKSLNPSLLWRPHATTLQPNLTAWRWPERNVSLRPRASVWCVSGRMIMDSWLRHYLIHREHYHSGGGQCDSWCISYSHETVLTTGLYYTSTQRGTGCTLRYKQTATRRDQNISCIVYTCTVLSHTHSCTQHTVNVNTTYRNSSHRNKTKGCLFSWTFGSLCFRHKYSHLPPHPQQLLSLRQWTPALSTSLSRDNLLHHKIHFLNIYNNKYDFVTTPVV